jgi:hypothetical protein
VVVVEVREIAVVDGGDTHGAHVARDPLRGRARAVGPWRGAARRRIAAVAGVEKEGRPVRQDEQGGVAAAGVDLVDVERAWRPSGQRLADGLRGERRGREQAGEQAAGDALAMEGEGYSRTQPGERRRRAPLLRAT